MKRRTRRMELEAVDVGRWSWKQWMQEDGIGRSGGRKMESEEVKVGRVDWVSQWFEKSRTATKRTHLAR